MNIINIIEQKYINKNLPILAIGDTIKVHQKIKEGNRERIQIFEGIIISIKNISINKNITVRKLSSGIGIEKIFPLHSPNISLFEVVKHGKVRRAKLYYLRDRIGKATKIKERI